MINGAGEGNRTLMKSWKRFVTSMNNEHLPEIVVEAWHPITYTNTMSQMLEKRVENLEKKVAALTGKRQAPSRKKNPSRTFGIFRNDPDFEEAARLGREYRERQTLEKEIAGS
jgi:hypothetical protein